MSDAITTPNGPTYNTEITLQPDVNMRELINIANNSVEIVTFDRALPSMNEIFIKTVEQNNAINNTPLSEQPLPHR